MVNRCCKCQHEFYSLYSICHDCYVDSNAPQTAMDTAGDKVEKLVIDISNYLNQPAFDSHSPSSEQIRKVVVDWVLNNGIKIV